MKKIIRFGSDLKGSAAAVDSDRIGVVKSSQVIKVSKEMR